MFEVKLYELHLNEEPKEKYEELVYAVERGKTDLAI